MSRVTRHRTSEDGQALVEFALVLPLLLMMVFGILEFGVLMMNETRIQNAAAAGARAGSLKGANSSMAVAAVNAAATGLVSCPLSTPTATNAGSPQQVTVTASCVYAPITPLGSLVAGTIVPASISAVTLMRVEN
jgi:Flp pilus assembly protein TadG